ncbi:MAG: hypothetical protein E7426_00400 [Ruminococcaceae bacterium]|jgi:hypothetical protein|nr:hypothetical protein [Oscillospiraceae bacterium]
MNTMDLYDGITALPDTLVLEAAQPSTRWRRWMRWGALAAALALVVGGGALILPHLHMGAAQGNSTGGDGKAAVYMHYTGPVLPLTVRGDAAGITAERTVEFDFSPYRGETVTEAGETYEHFRSETGVTDRYVLTNTTDTDRTLTLLYPEAGDLRGTERGTAAVTVDGAAVDTTLYVGPAGAVGDGAEAEAMRRINFTGAVWDDYRTLLSGAAYQDAAFAPLPVLTQRVTVYRLDDYVLPEGDPGTGGAVYFSFDINYDRTAVFTFGSNGGSWDRENGRCSLLNGAIGTDGGRARPMYVILLGDDIADYAVEGYYYGGGSTPKPFAVTAAVERREVTMDQVLTEIVAQSDELRELLPAGDTALTGEQQKGYISDYLLRCGLLDGTDGFGRYDDGRLEDMFEAFVMGRVLYSAFEVTIPAGGSAEIVVSAVKEASYDYPGGGRNWNRHGYDMATQLGSNLTFSGQRAAIRGTEYVTLLDSNFGFDPDGGVTEVALDTAQEHYWMQVARRVPEGS